MSLSIFYWPLGFLCPLFPSCKNLDKSPNIFEYSVKNTHKRNDVIEFLVSLNSLFEFVNSWVLYCCTWLGIETKIRTEASLWVYMCVCVFFFLNHIAMVNLSFRFTGNGKYLILNYLVLLVPGSNVEVCWSNNNNNIDRSYHQRIK